MADVITTLHPDGAPDTNLYPNIKLENIPFPVGYIYISADNTSPAQLFGGTWEKLDGVFLLGSSSTHPVNSTGGEESHTLSYLEMPDHGHSFSKIAVSNGASSGGSWHNFAVNTDWYTFLSDSAVGHINEGTSLTRAGGSQAHNNMPPFISVNMWKRIS